MKEVCKYSMALQLLKLTMSATQPTTTSNPVVNNYFYQVPAGGLTQAVWTIADTSWTDDSGTLVAADGIVPISTDNGFAQLTINGELQEADVLTSVAADQIVFTFPAPVTIEENKWIVVTVSNFAPVTTAPIIS